MSRSDAAQSVIDRRRRERDALIDTARRFARGIDRSLGVRSVVVFGSVARGDFNVWSDIDVLVIADQLPARPQDRIGAVGAAPRVSAIAWTPDEARRQARSGNPIAREALDRGVLVLGAPLGTLVSG